MSDNAMGWEATLRAAMAAHGIDTAAQLIGDGGLHRFRVHGDKSGSVNGWYVAHSDGVPAGAFGCWKRDVNETWCAKPDNELTPVERQQHTARIEQAQRQREAEEERAHIEAAKQAEQIWADAAAVVSHPYLDAKGIKAHGIRVIDGALVLPMRDASGELQSIQYIYADGKKLSLKDGLTAGAYLAIGKPDGRILLCEGFATGASLHEATGHAVAIAFGTANLKAVAEALHQKLPKIDLVVCADNDDAGIGRGKEAAKAVGAKYCVAKPANGNDFNDLHQQQGLEAVADVVNAAETTPEAAPEPEQTEPEGHSYATQLVKLARQHSELIHDRDGECYALIKIKGHRETLELKSRAFDLWLRGQFWRATRKAPSTNPVDEAIRTLEAQARYDGDCQEVYTRVAQHDGSYWIDLGDDQWRAVKVNQDGWEIVNDPPVVFRRSDSSRSLPIPEPGVNADDLMHVVHVVHVDSEHLPILVTWILECFRPETPFPILELCGEPGAAKSTTQDWLRELIDPNKVNRRAVPREIRDLFVTASQNWLFSLDNLSLLSREQQDALCILSTGGGFAGRGLYTDLEEVVAEVKRPVAINGIPLLARNQDMVDRTIRLMLQRIPDEARQGEIEVNQKFDRMRPRVFSALLTVFSKALKELPAVQLKELPRMADFARLGEAVCRAIDWPETFATVYRRLRLEAVADSLEGSPAIEALRRFIDREKNYSGTIGELWLSIKPEKYEEGWVRSDRGFGNLLRAHASALREVGYGVEFPKRKRSGRQVSISSIPEQRTQRAQRTPDTDRVVLSSADSALGVEYMSWKQ